MVDHVNSSFTELSGNSMPGNIRTGLNPVFLKASQWYLDLTKEIEIEINNWEEASSRTYKKDPNSYLYKKYSDHAKTKKAQKQAMVKFYTICEKIIADLENELWVKEQFENLMLLQVAALKQGKKIDVMKSVSKILKIEPEIKK